jgi:hypothetical protein
MAMSMQKQSAFGYSQKKSTGDGMSVMAVSVVITRSFFRPREARIFKLL